jgi:hypothetical protein
VNNHLEPGHEFIEAIEADGLTGLTRAVYRMIGENQPSAECIQEGDACFAGAADGDQAWDCALDLARCLRTSVMEPPEVDPEPPPEPPDPPTPPPEPPPTHPERDTAADVVLASLLVHLWRQRTHTDELMNPEKYSAREDF